MDAFAGAAERAFLAHVERPDFQLATLAGRWRVLRVQWPAADIAVRARNGTEWAFRFLLDGYPAQLPNAQPCDAKTGQALPPSGWPKGTGRVATAFNPNWNPNALYLPCDRLALPGHTYWTNTHPELLWRPAVGIIHYLEIIHELLSSSSYLPPLRSAA
ncbi:hypothetical protein [Acidisphaera sp. L21]|uniref:DUF7665 family protein n=1 Tax=Acidisphaera sp. L21 TaxID=1641851 RepID=UPI00131B65D5|nr:hypothetical protein [Acidisphaera sp. L21]